MSAPTKSNQQKNQQDKSNSISKGYVQAGKGAADSMLKDFFIDELKDIYRAEKHLVKLYQK